MADPAVFSEWTKAADHFLATPWRTSRFSTIGARARLSEPLPTSTASFDHLVDLLPSAANWHQLPDITRARLAVLLPKTSAEARLWTDQRLLHLWALVLNLPATRSELLSTLNQLRTVRWLIEQNIIGTEGGTELNVDFAARLGVLDAQLRSKTDLDTARLPPAEIWRETARQAQTSARQRVVEAVGLPMYSRLRAITWRARFAQRISSIMPFGLGGSSHVMGSKTDAEASGLLMYGPLPFAASAALGVDVPGAGTESAYILPELLPAVTERDALPLVAAIAASGASVTWTNAPLTQIFAARALADGRFSANDLWKRDFLTQLVASWPEPVALRAEAGLALIQNFARTPKNSALNDDDDSTTALEQRRAICLVALGRGQEADAHLGETEFRNWEALELLPPSTAPGIAEFALRRLQRHPGSSLHWWEMMETDTALAGRAPEALTLLQANKEKIDGNSEMLVAAALKDSGKFEAVAALLQEITARPFSTDGMAPTQQRADALLELLDLGRQHNRPDWQRLAVERVTTLIKYFNTERNDSSDGGDPWSKWPAKLVQLGNTELALAAAKLNTRWRWANDEASDAFLKSGAERANALSNSAAGAMTGVVQILALEKKHQAIINYLQSEDSWPALDLQEIASVVDPGFPPEQQSALAKTTADALDALGRNQEASLVRSAVHPGWENQLNDYLASPASISLKPEQRTALHYLRTNELPDDIDLDLVAVAQATELVPFTIRPENFPSEVFPLTAAAARLEHKLSLGSKVPMPRIENLRTFFLSSSTDLAPIRDALLTNGRLDRQ